jgi:hypothetical protein
MSQVAVTGCRRNSAVGVGGRWGMSWDDAELWPRWLWVNGNVDGRSSRTLAAFLARDLPSPPPPPDPYHSNDVADNPLSQR